MHDPLMSDQTTTTHASGPGAGAPLVAGRCRACGGASLFLANSHVTCARLECPDPTAVDDLLHDGPPERPAEVPDDADRRREWAAALRWEATGAVLSLDPDDTAILRRTADQIEAGQLTPWADQPEPDGEVQQVAPDDQESSTLAADPPGAAPAAAGPHPGTPDRAAGAELDLEAIGARVAAATPGPWWYDDSDQCWRLHGVHGVIPAQGPVPEQVVNHQILKAPKQGTPYQEYWPSPGDAEFIAHARTDVPALVREVRRLRSAAAIRDDFDQHGPSEWDPAVIHGLLDNLDGLDDEHRQPGDRCRSATGDHLRALVAEVRRLRAQVPDPQADLAREPDAPSELAAGLGPGIVGRAQLDASGDLWRERPPLTPTAPPRWSHGTRLAPSREWLDSRYGPATEVLLVSPSAGRVLDAARRWRAMYSHPWKTAADPELAAAVDALDGDQPAEPGPARCGLSEADCQGRWHPEWHIAPAEPAPERHADRAERDAEPAPEPDSGTGWDRDTILDAAKLMEPAGDFGALAAKQLRALLADADVSRERGRELKQVTSDLSRTEDALAEAQQSWERLHGRLHDQLAENYRAFATAVDNGGGPVRSDWPRALVSTYGDLWHLNSGGDLWLSDLSAHAEACTRAEVERDHGDVREVALVPADQAVELAEVTATCQRAHEAHERLTAERVDLVAELDRTRAELEAARVDADQADRHRAEVTADRDRLRSSLPVEAQDYWHWRSQAERVEKDRDVWHAFAEKQAAEVQRLREAVQQRDRAYDEMTAERDQVVETLAEARRDGYAELATARRDAAADALEWAAKETDRRIYDDGDAVAGKLSRLAAEIRAGTRQVPGSPQPAPAGGETTEEPS